MIRSRLLRMFVAGTLAGVLSTGPGEARLLEEVDPTDPEVVVSLQTSPGDATSPPVLDAEYWISRPELILMTLSAPTADWTFPQSGKQVPPLLLDGKSLAERPCFTRAGSGTAPARLQLSLSVEEFSRLMQAKTLELVHGPMRHALSPEQRAPLSEFWARLRPLVQDPGFRAHAMLWEGSGEAIATLLRGGWNPNRPTYAGRPPLLVVASQGNLEGANLLLKAGAKLEGVDPRGRTALHHAILQGHTDLAIELLDRGAPLALPDMTETTPLHLAVREGNALLVQNLLERGAAPNPRDAVGMTPLHHVSDLPAGPIPSQGMSRNLETGAERTGHPPRRSYDPVLAQLSPRSGPVELAEVLLRFGADPRMVVRQTMPEVPGTLDPTDAEGLTAFELALRRDDETMVKILGSSALIVGREVPDPRNDLTDSDPLVALSRLQERIRSLSASRLMREYVTRRCQEALARDPAMASGGGVGAAGALIRRTLDPRFSTVATEGAGFEVSRPVVQQQGPVTHQARVELALEDGVWKIDRFEPIAPAP